MSGRKAREQRRDQRRRDMYTVGNAAQSAITQSDDAWWQRYWPVVARVRPYQRGELPFPALLSAHAQALWRAAQERPQDYVIFVVRMDAVSEVGGGGKPWHEGMPYYSLDCLGAGMEPSQVRFLLRRATYQQDVAFRVWALGLPEGIGIAAWEVAGAA